MGRQMPIVPEDADYDNVELERRALRRRKEDEMFSSITNGGSSWVTAAKAVMLIGVPSVIAMWLVYQGSLWAPKIYAEEMEQRNEQTQERKLLDQQAIKQDQIFRLLQRICSNTAKTSEDRQRCFD
jgi:hypothetical protein